MQTLDKIVVNFFVVTLHIEDVSKEQWLAQWAHDPKVAGSSPAANRYLIICSLWKAVFLQIIWRI